MKFFSGAVIALFFILIPPVNVLADSSNDLFDSDIRIIESDQNGITFTYMAPGVDLYTPDGYPENYKAPMMPRTAQVAEPGVPLLPVKLIPLGVPFNSNPKVTVISQSYEAVAQVEVPDYISETSDSIFAAKVQSQSIKKNWPAQTVYIQDEVVVRGLKIVKVVLAATKLEAGTLYKAQTITVRVDYNAEQLAKKSSPRANGQAFEKVLSTIIANYSVAQNWRIEWPPIPYKTAMTASVFDSAETWIKIEIATSGIYKIGKYELLNIGVNLDDITPDQLRVFYGGGEELPVDNDEDRPELTEIPIRIAGGDDGSFDSADSILFYAESVDRPVYSESNERFVYLRNHYTSRNVYWLAIGGDFTSDPLRWVDIDGSLSSPFAVDASTFTDLEHEEQEYVFYSEETDCYNWYAGNSSQFSYNIQLQNVVSGNDATVITRSYAPFDSLRVNNVAADKGNFSNYFTTFTTNDLRSETGFNTFVIYNDTTFCFDYLDILYERWLDADGGQLNFYGPETIGTIEYTITGVPDDYILLDITSPFSANPIINGELTDSTLLFQHYSNGQKQYLLTTSSLYKTASSLEIYEADDLRSTSNGADYIIITHEDFYDQALELAAHRESMAPGLRVSVIDVENIYNQFSWGLFDPTAIRDFLKYAFENWEGAPPDYALLVGDGHYDYRNNWGYNVTNYIPPFHSIAAGQPYGSDDAYVYFGDFGYFDGDNSGNLDMIVGRLPVNSTDQMEIVLNKIVNYEASPELGKWRNTVVIAADDNLTAGKIGEVTHTNQAETLSTEHVPNSMEVKKVYLIEYPLRTGSVKPDAREALIAAFNEGGLIVDWIGHGSKSLWAHEQLFRRLEDMSRLTNIDKLPLIYAASCSIGYFDDPTEQGMAEDFVRYSGGGGIVSIAATRTVNGGENATLNQEVFDQLLYEDSVSFGQAYFIAKYLRQISGNDRKFMLFGDPALIAGKPVLKTELAYGPDSLRGLSADSLAGYVTNDSGVVQTGYNGTVWVLVKDASVNTRKYLTNYSGNPTGSYIDYIKPGPTLFYGPAEITNGYFVSKFFIPKDITYGGSGAKIFVYFDNEEIDGHGILDSLPMSGGLAAEEDSTGPTISIYYNDNLFTGDMQSLPDEAALEVRIYDDHGVNITGSMGHGIVVEIDDGDTYSTDITSDFVFDMGDWQQGSVAFEMPSLSAGEYQFNVKAWDNYNNSTVYSSYITIYADDRFAIDEVMNYPNPVVQVDSTVFQYMLTNDAESVTLKIFTLAGRKIRSFDLRTSEYTSLGYHYLPYNLRDSDGDRLASGVYIYKIEAVGTGFDGERRKTDFESKLAIIR